MGWECQPSPVRGLLFELRQYDTLVTHGTVTHSSHVSNSLTEEPGPSAGQILRLEQLNVASSNKGSLFGLVLPAKNVPCPFDLIIWALSGWPHQHTLASTALRGAEFLSAQ